MPLTEYSRDETIRLVAEDLRAARARLGITPAQAASRTGVAVDRYRTLEKGSAPSSDEFLREQVSVCRCLGVASVRTTYVQEIGQYVNIDLSRDAWMEPVTGFLDILEVDIAELPDRECFVSPAVVFGFLERIASPPPDRLAFSWLNRDAPVTAPHESVAGASFAQEPYLVDLPDGRLFMSFRTNRGEVWYAVSGDQGQTWDQARPLRTRDGGPKLRHPASPCPVFRLEERRYLLLLHDNDGYVFGADSRWHVRNRRPTYACVGEFHTGAQQPIRWGGARLLIDNDAVPWGPPGQGRLESAAYVSMTNVAGRRVLWYPDRKGFLLGKRLDDEWLAAGAD